MTDKAPCQNYETREDRKRPCDRDASRCVANRRDPKRKLWVCVNCAGKLTRGGRWKEL